MKVNKWIIIGAGLAVSLGIIGILINRTVSAEKPVDKCVGVVCTPRCEGIHLYNTVCDPMTGDCVIDSVKELNSPICGEHHP